jgi:hypothetical protein
MARNEAPRRCSLPKIARADGERQKGGMLQVDQVARRRSWAILAQHFFEKDGLGTEDCDFQSGGTTSATAGFSTWG